MKLLFLLEVLKIWGRVWIIMKKEHSNNSYTILLSRAMIFSIELAVIMAFLLLPTISQSASVSNGNGPIFDSPSVFNEKLIYLKSDTVLISWETDEPATSRVMYDTESKNAVMFSFDANNINHGYNFSTQQDNTLVTRHEMIVAGLTPNTQYFFRPESRVNNYARLGSEKTQSDRIPATTCGYISSYLKMGSDNNPGEILKLQAFLRDYEGFANINMTGVFDQATFDAVSAFQIKYASEVLAPWGITSPTGFVYYTTQKKINEILCGKILSLTKNQLDEINQARSSLELTPGNDGQIDFGTIINQGDDNNSYFIGNSDKKNENDKMQASVARTNVGPIRFIFNKFMNLFR